MVKRIAVAQGGGPTAVINDTLAGVVYEAQLNNFEVVGLKNGIEGGGLHPEIFGNLIDLTNIEPFLLRGIPGAYLGTTRLKLNPEKDIEDIQKIRRNMDCHGIDVVLYIGGNDSAATLRAEGKGIHIEKTEDNDLFGNDHTSGWGSASFTNTEIIRALTPDIGGFSPKVQHKGRECYSTAPVVVYQTQGRDAGWLTLGCSFAKINHAGDVIEGFSPHLFLPREIPYDNQNLLGKVDNLLSKQGFVFIVCGEELVNQKGKTLAELYGVRENEDSFGHTEHSRSGSFNYADFVASEIKKGLGSDVDIINGYNEIKETPLTPHHIQRTLMRSLVDAQEAFEAGREGIRAFVDGELNVSIALKRHGKGYDIRPTRISLDSVAGKVRSVDQKYIGGIEGPTPQFYKDFLPLIGGALAMTHNIGPELVPLKR